MAGFALTLQMPVGARAEPLCFPGRGVGASLQARGSELPSQPLHLPASAEPSFDLRRARLLGKLTPIYHGNKNTGHGVGDGGDAGAASGWTPQWRRVWREPSPASRRELRGTMTPVSRITRVHPAWPSVPWGLRTWAEGLGMLSTASPSASLQRLRFPASSGLGFNYLNCNATGEREAGNPLGKHPHPAPSPGGWEVPGLRDKVGPLALRRTLVRLGGCAPAASGPLSPRPQRGSA